MGTETEPAKTLLPYLQRADELQKHEPLVAYYCRLYAMEKGLKIPPKERTKTTNSLLVSLMNQLEKDKKSLKLGNEDYLYVEGFALNVFSKADKQDRAGRADLNTAKTFYAASIFFEILYQFGELQPDIEQKQKYAVWKAADIRKALKEGRKPVPGPPGGEQDSSIAYDTSTNIYDLGPTEDAPPSHPGGTDTIPPPPYKAAYQPPSHRNLDYPPDEFHPPPPPQHQPTSPPSHRNLDYPPDEFHQPPPPQQPDNSSYPQTFHQPQPPQQPDNSSYPQTYHQPQPPQQPDNSSYPQTYHQERPPPQNYPSHEDVSPYHQQHISNYQSYPSFNHGDPPSAPSNYSSYYQGSEASYSHPSVPSATEYPPTVQYNSSSDDGYRAAKPAAPPAAPKYTYDSNYQPEPEKITEAHKAARFAVGALAFDDIPVAVEFLSRSLELLTNPSASANSSSHA